MTTNTFQGNEGWQLPHLAAIFSNQSLGLGPHFLFGLLRPIELAAIKLGHQAGALHSLDRGQP